MLVSLKIVIDSIFKIKNIYDLLILYKFYFLQLFSFHHKFFMASFYKNFLSQIF